MVEVQAAAFRRGRRAYRAAVRSTPLALREARRTWNRDRIGLVAELRCECTRPSCRDRLPAVAERHRSAADQFLVAPAHLEDGVVVRAADRFFVVESCRRATRVRAGETAAPL